MNRVYLIVPLILVGHVVIVSCNDYENCPFSCSEKRTCQSKRFCDGHKDCLDGEDEWNKTLHEEFDPFGLWQNCNNSENKMDLECRVMRDRICSGEVKCRNLSPCDLKCRSYYKCKSGTCVPRSTVCNGSPCDGCGEDHGWDNGQGFKCKKDGRKCLLPQQLLHDDIPDCDGGDDLCFRHSNSSSRNELQSPNNLDRSKCFLCYNDNMLIPKSRVCDGIIDCSDFSDECLCENAPDICQRVITFADESLRQELYKNTEKTEKETKTMKKSNSYCKVGQVLCRDGSCIPKESVCDGVVDCDEDESNAICDGTIPCQNATHNDPRCRCTVDFSCKISYGVPCNGIGECFNPVQLGWESLNEFTFPDDECKANCPVSEIAYNCEEKPAREIRQKLYGYFCDRPRGVELPEHYTTDIEGDQYCDGKIDCELMGDDEVECDRTHDRIYCNATRPSYVSIRKNQTCDGVVDCVDESDESVELCGNTRFRCPNLGGTKMSIDSSLVCDFEIACDNAEDEMNCTDERFYCENARPLFIRKNKTYDNRGDCSDWSDECPTINESTMKSVFSSRYELIENIALRSVMWIAAFVAIFGNVGVIAREGLRLHQMSELKSAIVANRVLILNLAVSDLIMGIYLLGLASVSVLKQGKYCSQDIGWRSSSTCTVLGVLSVISSETSVMTMVLLAGCRFYTVLKPFDSSSRPTRKVLILMVLTTWITSFTIALLPLTDSLSNIFVNRAIVGDNPLFADAVVQYDTMKNFFRKKLKHDLRLNVTYPEQIENFLETATWTELISSSKQYFAHRSHDFQFSGYFGYYSEESVCIPKFFATTSDPAWKYSLAINVFNFTSFVLVASSFIAIYSMTRKDRKKMTTNIHYQKKEKSEEKSLAAMQFKILRLIVTDFCCWIPICIMAFCKLGGIYISPTAYAVAAIVLLPINSALNPLLYSDMFDVLWNKITTNKRAHKQSIQETLTTDRSRKSLATEGDIKIV